MTDLSSSFSKIYPKEFELKVEYRGKHAATFLDLDITIKDSIFIDKLFCKRDKFMYFIVRMLHMSSNILSSIFSGSKFFLWLHYLTSFLVHLKYI